MFSQLKTTETCTSVILSIKPNDVDVQPVEYFLFLDITIMSKATTDILVDVKYEL